MVQSHSVCYNDPVPQGLLQWSCPTVSIVMIQSQSICYSNPVPQHLLQWSHSVYYNDPVPPWKGKIEPLSPPSGQKTSVPKGKPLLSGAAGI